MSNSCVCCSREIPEGSMVCKVCNWEAAQKKEELTKGELTKELYIHKKKLEAHKNYTQRLEIRIAQIEKSLSIDLKG